MIRLVPIVEGKGDVKAYEKLANRILAKEGLSQKAFVQSGISSFGCGNLDKKMGLENYVRIAQDIGDGIIVVRDSDDSCPVEVFREYWSRICLTNPSKPTAVSVAVREFENWALASCQSLRGVAWAGADGINPNATIPTDPETVDAKDFLNKNRAGSFGYRETTHQVILASLIDLDLCEANSNSFKVFKKRILELIRQIEDQQTGPCPQRLLASIC